MPYKHLFSIFSLILLSANAFATELCGSVKQGEIVFGKTTPDSKIFFNHQEISKTDDGIFILAFGRDEKQQQSLIIETGKNSENYDLTVSPAKWDIQNIKGVPPRKVTPSDTDLEAIELERKVIRAALKETTDSTGWRSGFILPVEGRISGKFGGQRIMNKIPKSPHQGMDIAAKEGTEVKASADGEVILAYPDLFYSGNVIIIDHGFGLQTIYAHLSKMNVKRGDKVKKGDIIGLVGKTGRATGAHLHWGASLRNVRFNPQSLIESNDIENKCYAL